ncbi:unnamed protein product, partial [Ectocarpus sp. 12 AP-2014]
MGGGGTDIAHTTRPTSREEKRCWVSRRRPPPCRVPHPSPLAAAPLFCLFPEKKHPLIRSHHQKPNLVVSPPLPSRRACKMHSAVPPPPTSPRITTDRETKGEQVWIKRASEENTCQLRFCSFWAVLLCETSCRRNTSSAAVMILIVVAVGKKIKKRVLLTTIKQTSRSSERETRQPKTELSLETIGGTTEESFRNTFLVCHYSCRVVGSCCSRLNLSRYTLYSPPKALGRNVSETNPTQPAKTHRPT